MELDAALFAVLDVETTGKFPDKGDRVCEVGSIKLRSGREVGRFHSLVHPGCAVPEEARQIHRISDDMLREAPPFATISRDLRQFLAGSVMIAQNARFDLGFMNAEFRRAGLGHLTIPVVDTISLARRVRPGLSSYSLDRLAHHFQVRIQGNGRHRSLGDCEVTLEIFLQCLKVLRQTGEIRTVEDLVKKAGVS